MDFVPLDHWFVILNSAHLCSLPELMFMSFGISSGYFLSQYIIVWGILIFIACHVVLTLCNYANLVSRFKGHGLFLRAIFHVPL